MPAMALPTSTTSRRSAAAVGAALAWEVYAALPASNAVAVIAASSRGMRRGLVLGIAGPFDRAAGVN